MPQRTLAGVAGAAFLLCACAPEPFAVLPNKTTVKVKGLLDDPLQVAPTKWYGQTESPLSFDKASDLLHSEDPMLERVRVCVQNIIAKMAAPPGDPSWDGRKIRAFSESVRSELRRWRIDDGKLEGVLESWESPVPELQARAMPYRMVDYVTDIDYVTKQRIYAELEPEIYEELLAGGPFGRDIFEWSRLHDRWLKDFIRSQGCKPDDYDLESWREKRKKGSLQCVIAIPKSGEGRYFADIDIDRHNPNADAASIPLHWFGKTNHLNLQCKSFFVKQPEIPNWINWIHEHS